MVTNQQLAEQLQVNVLHRITFSEEHCTALLCGKSALFRQSYESLDIKHTQQPFC